MSKYLKHHAVRNDGTHTLETLAHFGEAGVVVFNDIDTVTWDSHIELLNYILIADNNQKLIIGEVTETPPYYDTEIAFAEAVRPLIRPLHTELTNNQ